MTEWRPTGLLPVLVALAGCGSAPLVPITYDDTVSVTSELPASVVLNTERVTGHESSTMVYAGGVFVPVSSGPVPQLQFGRVDQATFIESLKSELVRLGVVGTIVDDDATEPMRFLVNFVHTEHFPNFQQYKLTVSFLADYRGLTLANRYEVLSSDGDSTWEKWNTDAKEGKKKAATKLLDLLMRDIEIFVRQAVAMDEATKPTI